MEGFDGRDSLKWRDGGGGKGEENDGFGGKRKDLGFAEKPQIVCTVLSLQLSAGAEITDHCPHHCRCNQRECLRGAAPKKTISTQADPRCYRGGDCRKAQHRRRRPVAAAQIASEGSLLLREQLSIGTEIAREPLQSLEIFFVSFFFFKGAAICHLPYRKKGGLNLADKGSIWPERT